MTDLFPKLWHLRGGKKQAWKNEHLGAPSGVHLSFDKTYKLLRKRLDEFKKDITIIHDPIEKYKISKKTKHKARKDLDLKYKNICLFVGHFMWQTNPTIIVNIAKKQLGLIGV